MLINAKAMKKLFIGSLFLFFILNTGCRDCYVCESFDIWSNKMVDFYKECGTADEKQNMEEEFRAMYPDSLDYRVVCR
ncbi:MAG: hypothetical protein C0594_15335 [Marinilabiliales bacterium]|nr:MAG: hypothetical protein C0594_15335 [Marinilabiliales bacterium]